MKVWIELCTLVYGKLSWDGVVKLIRRDHNSQGTNLTHNEIDLSFGAKYRKANITHIFFVFFFNIV